MSVGHNFGAGSFDLGHGATVLVEDMVDAGKGYAHGPERALMSALLFDGVQSYMSYVCATSEEVKAKYREAYTWVTRAEKEYVFSFENVCEGLGLDPEFLRLGLINASHARIDGWKRARRNF